MNNIDFSELLSSIDEWNKSIEKLKNAEKRKRIAWTNILKTAESNIIESSRIIKNLQIDQQLLEKELENIL